jgi:integrase
VIKLHEGRHSAASLARDAGVDRNIRQAQLGHATGTMTDHYTHVEAASHRAAAEAVAKLLGEASA